MTIKLKVKSTKYHKFFVWIDVKTFYHLLYSYQTFTKIINVDLLITHCIMHQHKKNSPSIITHYNLQFKHKPLTRKQGDRPLIPPQQHLILPAICSFRFTIIFFNKQRNCSFPSKATDSPHREPTNHGGVFRKKSRRRKRAAR